MIHDLSKLLKVLADETRLRLVHVLAREEVSVSELAEVLNLSRAEVHGVVSFYHDFRRTPPGRHVVKICRAEACQAMGSDRVYAEVTRACAADGEVTVEPVYCLGNCALSPAALVNGKLYGRVDAAKALALVDR